MSGVCPRPDSGGDNCVHLAHGEGGRLSRQMVRRRILPRFTNRFLEPLGDAAELPPLAGPPVITTDGFVVSPLFFPGGDIGCLSVYGTTNDLAVAGARPRWLSLGLILEEGLADDVLDRVLDSIARAAEEVGVRIVTGDTKVVPRGAVDRLFITTTGLGERLAWPLEGPGALAAGDAVIVTGPVGRHGFAVLAARENLGIDPPPASDCGSLWPAIEALAAAGVHVRAMRDATRGGVAAVWHEWAEASGQTLAIQESAVTVTPSVRGLSELLGIDPLHVANEGTMVLAVPADAVEPVMAVLRGVPITAKATVVGRVERRGFSPVTVRGPLGRARPLDEPLGAPLPRIC